MPAVAPAQVADLTSGLGLEPPPAQSADEPAPAEAGDVSGTSSASCPLNLCGFPELDDLLTLTRCEVCDEAMATAIEAIGCGKDCGSLVTRVESLAEGVCEQSRSAPGACASAVVRVLDMVRASSPCAATDWVQKSLCLVLTTDATVARAVCSAQVSTEERSTLGAVETAECAFELNRRVLSSSPCASSDWLQKSVCLAATTDAAAGAACRGQISLAEKSSLGGGEGTAGTETSECVERTLTGVRNSSPCPASDWVQKSLCLAFSADAAVARAVCGSGVSFEERASLGGVESADCAFEVNRRVLASAPCPSGDWIEKSVCLAAMSDASVARLVCGTQLTWGERSSLSATDAAAGTATGGCLDRTLTNVRNSPPCAASDWIQKTLCLAATTDATIARAACGSTISLAERSSIDVVGTETGGCVQATATNVRNSRPCAAADWVQKSLCLVLTTDATVARAVCSAQVSTEERSTLGAVETAECAFELNRRVLSSSPCASSDWLQKSVCLAATTDAAAGAACRGQISLAEKSSLGGGEGTAGTETSECVERTLTGVRNSSPCPASDWVQKSLCLAFSADAAVARAVCGSGVSFEERASLGGVESADCAFEVNRRVLASAPCPSGDWIEKSVCLAAMSDASVARLVCGTQLTWGERSSLSATDAAAGTATGGCLDRTLTNVRNSPPCAASDWIQKTLCLAATTDATIARAACGSTISLAERSSLGTLESASCAGATSSKAQGCVNQVLALVGDFTDRPDLFAGIGGASQCPMTIAEVREDEQARDCTNQLVAVAEDVTDLGAGSLGRLGGATDCPADVAEVKEDEQARGCLNQISALAGDVGDLPHPALSGSTRCPFDVAALDEDEEARACLNAALAVMADSVGLPRLVLPGATTCPVAGEDIADVDRVRACAAAVAAAIPGAKPPLLAPSGATCPVQGGVPCVNPANPVGSAMCVAVLPTVIACVAASAVLGSCDTGVSISNVQHGEALPSDWSDEGRTRRVTATARSAGRIASFATHIENASGSSSRTVPLSCHPLAAISAQIATGVKASDPIALCPAAATRELAYDTSELIDGVNRVGVSARDMLGRQSPIHFWEIKIDRQAPDLELSGALSTHEDQFVPGGPLPLGVRASDLGAGVRRIDIQVNGRVVASTGDASCQQGGCQRQLDWTFHPLEHSALDGERYDISIKAYDAIGHETSRTLTVYYATRFDGDLDGATPLDVEPAPPFEACAPDPEAANDGYCNEVPNPLDDEGEDLPQSPQAPKTDPVPSDPTDLLDPLAPAAPGLVVGPSRAWGIADNNRDMFQRDARPELERLGVRRVRLQVNWDVMKGELSDERALLANQSGERGLNSRQRYYLHVWNWLREVEEYNAAVKDQTKKLTPLIAFLSRPYEKAQPGQTVLAPVPVDVPDYGAWVQRFREKFPWVREYVAWNEVNSDGYTKARPDRAARLYKHLDWRCDTAQGRAPTCKAAAGSFVDFPNLVGRSTQEGASSAYVQKFLKSLKGYRVKFWALHGSDALNHRNYSAFDQFLLKTSSNAGFNAMDRGENVWLTEQAPLVEFTPTKATAVQYSQTPEQAGANLREFLRRMTSSNNYRRVKRFYLYEWIGDNRCNSPRSDGLGCYDSGIRELRPNGGSHPAPRDAYGIFREFTGG